MQSVGNRHSGWVQRCGEGQPEYAWVPEL